MLTRRSALVLALSALVGVLGMLRPAGGSERSAALAGAGAGAIAADVVLGVGLAAGLALLHWGWGRRRPGLASWADRLVVAALLAQALADVLAAAGTHLT